MKLSIKIIAVSVVVVCTVIIQYLKCKFPVFFLNFNTENLKGGFVANSEWCSSSSNEVNEYVDRQKRRTKYMLIFEIVALSILFIFE